MPGNHLVGELSFGCVYVKIPVFIKKRGILKFMEIREHRTVHHIVSVNYGHSVGKLGAVAILYIKRARVFVVAVNITVKIKIIRFFALENRIIDISIRNFYPRENLFIGFLKLFKINRILRRFSFFRLTGFSFRRDGRAEFS
jgi:hypothetical protein